MLKEVVINSVTRCRMVGSISSPDISNQIDLKVTNQQRSSRDFLTVCPTDVLLSVSILSQMYMLPY